MIKQWLGISISAVLLTACTTNDTTQQRVSQPPPTIVCDGPIVDITGQEPRFETLNPAINQDYQRDGKRYRIVQDPARYSESGFAAIYDAEPSSNLTATGEAFDPSALTAAHPTLPIPSYARITNLANNRMLIVRINDRGPYGNDRVISLSRAAADRLNTSNNSKVRIDPIVVDANGTLSGPGMACVNIAKQTFSLPSRPDLSGGMGSATTAVAAPVAENDIRPVSNTALETSDTMGAPIHSGGFLGAPTPLRAGVLEEEPAPQPAVSEHTTPVVAVAPRQSSTSSTSQGKYVVQVGAVSDPARANQLLNKLKQQMGTSGAVSHNGAVYRVQLGPFTTRSEAARLQQRLQSEAQQASFITQAP